MREQITNTHIYYLFMCLLDDTSYILFYSISNTLSPPVSLIHLIPSREILQSVAEACDEGAKGRWVIHAQTGGWIVDLATRQQQSFEREGNSYSYEVRVRVLDDDDDEDGKDQGFSRPGRR